MKVLILGGTRFFGRELAMRLARDGHEVTVLTRGQRPIPPGVSHISGDRNDRATLGSAAAAGFDAVVDNIAYDGESAGITVEAFAGRTGHLVLTSSVAVYPASGRPPFFENAPLAAPDSVPEDVYGSRRYVRGKIEAELVVMRQEQVPWSIVRPPIVVGPADPTLRLHYYVQRVLDGGPILLPGGGDHCFHLADSRDLAGGMALILGSPGVARGQIYNLCQDETLSLHELVGAVARGCERKCQIIEMPRRLPSNVGVPIHNPLGPHGQPFIAPPHKACRELGFKPRPVLDVVEEAAGWHALHSSEDSEGYANRASERELAREFSRALGRMSLRRPD